MLESEAPATSELLIESKSLKLYLNSFNNKKFENENKIHGIIQKDLNATVQKSVAIKLSNLSKCSRKEISRYKGKSINRFRCRNLRLSSKLQLIKTM